MKISEIFPTYEIFKELVINVIDTDFNSPFWNNDEENYTKNKSIYNSLLKLFNLREALCNINNVDNWIGLFIINYQEQKPYLYKRQQIFFEDNIKLLQKIENWGDNTDNSGGITTTRDNENNTTGTVDSKNNQLDAGQDIKTTFKTINDDDAASSRTQNELNSKTTMNQKGKETTTNENNSSVNDYNINQALEDINQRVVVLGIQDFLQTFNYLFKPYKIIYDSTIFC